MGRTMAMRDDTKDELDRAALEASLGDGQKRRLALFRAVEIGVCTRIEALCERTGLAVTDVAVLVIGPTAPEVFFKTGEDRVINVVMGHRIRMYALLSRLLPQADDAPADPYRDLLEPSPEQCVRVLIVDEQSITVLSYGSFVTVRIDPARRAVA